MISFISFDKLHRQYGFSLIEMAIVLVILGLLLGGLIMPLTSQREVAQREATERQLQEIRNAIVGFAQINNRLPCPAAPGTNGVEFRFATGPNTGNCRATSTPLLPFQALGIHGNIIGRDLVDAWQRPIRYRLTNPTGANWSYARWLTPFPAQLPSFRICNDTACGTNQIIATEVAAVAFSTGPDGASPSPSISPDQQENQDVDDDFVMRPHTGDARTDQEFDDILVWISGPTLVYELSRAGQ